MELSIVVPTWNEAESLPRLVAQVEEALAGIEYEIIVVDDGSPDGTADMARGLGARAIERQERGLATAVVRGLQEATGTYVAVMDADLQHPPTAVRDMLEAADGAELVVASRYLPGGSDGAFGPFRKLLSRGAALAARIALPPVRQHDVTDPMSGLFLVRRDAIHSDTYQPKGYKVLLEILGREHLETVREVPYEFRVREHGASKLGATVMVQYMLHLAALAWMTKENQRMLRFGLVGLTGIVVNLGILAFLHDVVGWHDLLAVAIAIETSIIWNHFWNDRFTFRDRHRSTYFMRLVRFNAVSLGALAVNFATYATLTRFFGIQYLIAEGLAILVAFGVNYTGNFHWTYGTEQQRVRPAIKRALPWVPFVLVVASAYGLYLNDLDDPDSMVFDEHYYVTVAYQLREGIWEDPCWADAELSHRPLNYEHPPLAKFIIATSVKLQAESEASLPVCRDPDSKSYRAFQNDLEEEDPRVWRTPSALFGVVAVAAVGLVAGRLWGPFAALAGSALILAEGTVFAAARLALLDIFAAAFLLVAVYLATFPSGRAMTASMMFLGLGFASKYTVAFAGPAVLALAMWSISRTRQISTKETLQKAAGYGGAAIGIWLATYLPWLKSWASEMGVVGAMRHWIDLQVAAFTWGAQGKHTHAYISPPSEWLLLQRPTVFYHDRAVGGDESQWQFIYSMGNPALYWLAVAAFVLAWLPAVWATVRPGGAKGDLRLWWHGLGRGGQALRVVSLLPLAVYGTFFVLTRSTYAFYMAIVAPLMAILVAGAMAQSLRSKNPWVNWWPIPAVALALSWFLHYYPIIAGHVIPVEDFRLIMETWPGMKE